MAPRKRKGRAAAPATKEGRRRRKRDPNTVGTSRYIRKRTAPIDAPQHLQTLALCTNRVLQEPGLTRAILDYYKNILVDDVIRRMHQITGEYLAALKPEKGGTKALLDELFSYTEHYAKHEHVLDNFQSTLELIAKRHAIVRKAVTDRIMTTLETSHDEHGMERHASLAKCLFVTLQWIIFSGPGDFDMEWKSCIVDRLLDEGHAESILYFGTVSMENVTFFGLSVIIDKSLRARPASRHYNTWHVRFREIALAQISAWERQEHEQDHNEEPQQDQQAN